MVQVNAGFAREAKFFKPAVRYHHRAKFDAGKKAWFW
jgi:hypothetical protein